MNAKHTPGPWQSTKCKAVVKSADYWAIIEEGDESAAWAIAEIDCDREAAEANAKLIAAAPELLAACEAAFSDYQSDTFQQPTEALLRAAIAKAKGGAQ